MTPPSGDIEQQVYEQRLAVVDIASGRLTPSASRRIAYS